MSTGASRAEISYQVRSLNSLHERVIAACWTKCIVKPKDAELSIADMACIDRCVPKYFETQALVRKELEAARKNAPLEYP